MTAPPINRTMHPPAKYLYTNNTGCDTRVHHDAIVAACKAGGVFDDDLADIFVLTRCPPGSACEWALNFA
jgi:hypothetical protein